MKKVLIPVIMILLSACAQTGAPRMTAKDAPGCCQGMMQDGASCCSSMMNSSGDKKGCGCCQSMKGGKMCGGMAMPARPQ